MTITTIEAVQFIVLIPSVLLYILFLVTLTRFRSREPFNSEFFKLSFNLGICDILNLLNGWVLYKFPSFDWMGMAYLAKKFPKLAKISVMLSWELGLNQHLGVLFLTFNRFTGIVMPLRHQLIWTRKFVFMMMALQWLLPLFAVLPQLTLPYGYVTDNDTGEMSKPHWLDHDAQQKYFIGFLTYNIIINIITLIMYVVIFYHVRKTSQEESVTDVDRHDLKMAIYGFCIFLVLFLYGSYAVLRVNLPPSDPKMYKTVTLMYGVCSDVFSWCNPWLCLLLLGKVRRHMKATLFCKRNYTEAVAVVPGALGLSEFKPITAKRGLVARPAAVRY